MRNPPVAAVGARTEGRSASPRWVAWLCVLTIAAGPAGVEAGRPRALRIRRPPKIEDLWLRFTFFDQYGRGFQSKAGPPRGPGSERLIVYQPSVMLVVRQGNPRWTHQIAFALDVVSSASADGLDAVSSASRDNEAGELDVVSTYTTDAGTQWSLRYGFHFEEPLRSGFFGVGWARGFADDNTTISYNSQFVFDSFDDIDPLGYSVVEARRYTISDNVSLAQVLSPTTLLGASYGLTFQSGRLATTWNSVYVEDAIKKHCPDDPTQSSAYDCPNRRPERMPPTRMRHAFSLQLLQHAPRTRTTAKLGYRYYIDDFNLRAHTPSISLYQWLGRRAYVRVTYRNHLQTGVSFYTVGTRTEIPEDMPLTADSDLAPFSAHQFGMAAVIYLVGPRSLRGTQALDIGYNRYQRSNDLRVNVFSIGYARHF